jgi:hypothetical protein
MKYYLFIGLTILSIISQLPHSWYTFNSFSRLGSQLRILQSVAFCFILSVAIFAFVYIEKPGLALLGAAIEAIINLYYYSLDFWTDGYKAYTGDRNEVNSKRRRASSIWWRKNWIAIFFGLLLPVLIYVFADQMMRLK